ncbi:hypothetical protein BET10_08285 [Pseudoalteromonas amylolytica]|uniref:Integral membrane protein n=1 Tax=Pseudoalteromonas amylolytica TaxID=1859457 RepID=A0A1S1MTL7_9GAMM|nr:hypothetical protein BFC16_08170 [Pseudoalteromonas sp. JW3]OHU90872.1 hypothetical protein BET10_08285 [Pseudoalteromonas amylolytica]
MKFSQLITLIIFALTIFYILVGNPKITSEIYVTTIALTALYGLIRKEPNVLHIALILMFINLVEYIIFAYGIIDLSTAGKNRILHGVLIFGTHLLITVTSVILLIFRVQISRVLSRSTKIELTYFDGLFHWTFIYLALVSLLGLVEHLARHVLGFHSITIIYYNFTSLVYIGWAVSCALLLTMVIVTEKKHKQRRFEPS